MLISLTSYHMFFWSLFFWQHWPVGCAGCTDLGCFWQTSLCTNFGQQFFRGPRYVVNSYCLLADELKTNIQYLIHFLSHGSTLSGFCRLGTQSGWNTVHPHFLECRPDSGTDFLEWWWLPGRRMDSSLMTPHLETRFSVSNWWWLLERHTDSSLMTPHLETRLSVSNWWWLPEHHTDSSLMTSHPDTGLFVSIVTPWPSRSTI